MSTHITALPGQIAETVLLPGDPLRAQYIAENFLDGIACYSTVRNMLGYTGTAPDGRRITVQGAGIGQPSLSAYVNELIDLGAKRIIRVGTCGAMQVYLGLGDIIIAIGSCTDSAMNARRFAGMTYAPIADSELLFMAHAQAKKLRLKVRFGNILATDTFWDRAKPPNWSFFAPYGVLAIEMETSEFYTLGAEKNVQTLTLLTVSDNLVTGEKMSPEEREKAPDDIIRLALAL